MLEQLAQEIGDPPLRGTRFLYTYREMIGATREIEDAARERLLVGFQRAEKLEAEAERYRALTERGVAVTALGVGELDEARFPGLHWVQLSFDRAALANQWFLVVREAEPLAFVSFELSSEERFGRGGVSDPDRRFVGFVSEDPGIVEAVHAALGPLLGHNPRIDDAVLRAAANARLVLAFTDDGSEAAYAGTRAGATEIAARANARVLLYDRSAESYLVDPYPYPDIIDAEKALDGKRAEALGRSYLKDQIDEAASSGLEATAWLPTHPGPRGVAECLSRFAVDLIVLPEEIADPSLLDRVRGNTLSKYAAAADVPIVLAAEDGGLRLAEAPAAAASR